MVLLIMYFTLKGKTIYWIPKGTVGNLKLDLSEILMLLCFAKLFYFAKKVYSATELKNSDKPDYI